MVGILQQPGSRVFVKRYIGFIAAAIQVVVFCFGAQASQSVSLGWSPCPDPNMVEYAVYYGNASGAYSHRLDVGTNTTAVVAGLTEGQTFFFVVVDRKSVV
jgi:hypothetical protein